LRRCLRVCLSVRSLRGGGMDRDDRPLRELFGGGVSEDPALRATALEALLVEKGVLSTDAIDAVVEHYERELGPQHGARVVARAWVEPASRERLLTDGTAAVQELGIGGVELNTLVAVENTPR